MIEITDELIQRFYDLAQECTHHEDMPSVVDMSPKQVECALKTSAMIKQRIRTFLENINGQKPMPAAELVGWFEIASTLWERGILRHKKGPGGILAIMMYARELSLTSVRPKTAIELVSEQARCCRRLIQTLADFAGITLEIKRERASNMLIQTIRECLTSIMVPEEMRREIVAWLAEFDSRWPHDVAALYHQELTRFVPARGKTAKEHATGKQWELITELLKCRQVPATVKRQIASFQVAPAVERTKSNVSAWIETLQFYKYGERMSVD